MPPKIMFKSKILMQFTLGWGFIDKFKDQGISISQSYGNLVFNMSRAQVW